MACDICGRSSCCNSFHSLAEQKKYEKVIDAFDKARELRDEIKHQDDPEPEQIKEETGE